LATVVGAALLAAAGCSSSLEPVKGVVRLDGNPLEGATVTLVSESGTETYMGTTDSKGEFALTSSDGRAGAKAGTYKAVVIKSGSKGEPMAPGDPNAMKMMEKEAKPGPPKPGGPSAPRAPGMSGPGKGGPAAPPGPKTDLPTVYASAETTPFKGIKIPTADKQPIALDLKSNP
jgi:hypothetical protein